MKEEKKGGEREEGKDREGSRTNRRTHLRDIYRRQGDAAAAAVDIEDVRRSVERIVIATQGGWRKLAVLDPLSLADSGTRGTFEELEFLVNRALCELNGVKHVVTLARHLA